MESRLGSWPGANILLAVGNFTLRMWERNEGI